MKLKKYFFLFFLLLLINAQFSRAEYPEAAIRQGKHVEWFRSASTGNEGEVIMVWSDTRTGGRDVYAQKINVNGDLVWGEEGAAIIQIEGRQEDPVCITDGSGGVVISWIDFRSDSTGDVYAQRVDADGNLLWDAEGIPLCTNVSKQISLRMADDDNHGAYVCWNDYRNSTDGDLYISHIDSAGNVEAGWQENGLAVCAELGVQGSQSIDKDGAGGAIVTWADTRVQSDVNLYAQRFTKNGTYKWTENGMMICNDAGAQESPKLVFTTPLGVIVSWRDFREDNQGDIYVQRLDTAGTLLWGEAGIPLDNAAGTQINPRITSDSQGGVIVVWEDYKVDPYYPDIYGQRISADGDFLWGENSIAVTSGSMSQIQPRVISDNSGGGFVIWMDERNGAFPKDDIYGQHIDSAGNVTWEQDGLLICNASLYQFSPLFRSDGSDGAIAIWGDARTGSIGIFGQYVDNSGILHLQENGEQIYFGIDGDARTPKIIADKNKDMWVFWQDHRKAFLGTYIYMQKMYSNMDLQFENNGKQICSVAERFQTNFDVILDDTTFYAAWEDLQMGIKQVYVQKINFQGKSLWDSVGIKVKDTYADQIKPIVISDQSEGMIVGWSDLRSYFDYDVYAQRYDENGNPLWGEEGVQITAAYGDDNLQGFFCFGDTLIAVWQGGDWSDQNLYYRLLDIDGNFLTDSLALCDTSGNQTNPTFAKSENHLLIVWEDRRGFDGDLYHQIINSDGSLLFSNQGELVCGEINDQSRANASIWESDNSPYYSITWQDFRNGTDFDIYLKSWLESGVEDEKIISDKSYNQLNPKIDYINKNEGNCSEYYIVYEDYSREVLSSDIISYSNSEGETPICLASNKQVNPVITGLQTSDFPEWYILWEDKRSSGKTELTNLYASFIDILVDNIDEQPNTPKDFNLISAYPNPFNPEVTLKTRIREPGNVTLSIYNLQGQMIFQEKVHTGQSGYWNYQWNGKNSAGRLMPSGLYFCKIKTKNNVLRTTVTLVR